MAIPPLPAWLRTKAVLLFCLAFGVRLAALLFFIWWFRLTGHMPGFAFYPVLGGDSLDYAVLTRNLFEHGIFSSSLEEPLVPESFRLPGYSFFLLPFQALPHALYFGVLAQMLLASGTVALTYLFGKKFLSAKVGLVAALLLAFEPISILNSVIVMSDTVFVFSVVLGMYLLFLHGKNWKEQLALGFFAGAFFGYAVLTRVIAEYLAFCLVPAYLILFRKREPWKQSVAKLVVFLAMMGCILIPWSLRNHSIFGTFTLSSTPYINFTQYNLAYFYAYQHHLTPPEVAHRYTDPIPYPITSYWFRSLANEAIFKQEIHDGLSGNVLPYLGFHLVKTIPFFVNDGLRDINLVTGFFPRDTQVTNFTDLLLKGDYARMLAYFSAPRPELYLLVIGSAFWVSVSALWIIGVLIALLRRKPALWFMLVGSGIILYFALLSSPVIQPRYRVPATPFILLLAVEGAMLLRSELTKRRTLLLAPAPQ